MNALEQHISFQVGLQFADLITLAWRMAVHLRNIMINGISDKWLYDAHHLLLELEQLNPQEFKKRVLEASYSK